MSESGQQFLHNWKRWVSMLALCKLLILANHLYAKKLATMFCKFYI